MHNPPVVQVGHSLGYFFEDRKGPIQRVLRGETDHLVEGGGVFDTRDYRQVGISGAGPAEEDDVVVANVPQHIQLLLELVPHEGEGAAVGLEQNLSVPVARSQGAELTAPDFSYVANLLEVDLPVCGLGRA